MQLNLHELINQPGYGKANEAVRKAGCWAPHLDDTERIDWLESKKVTVRNIKTGVKVIRHEPQSYAPDFLRKVIDAAAVKETKEEAQS